jgi:hypothetical protein
MRISGEASPETSKTNGSEENPYQDPVRNVVVEIP